MPKQNSRRSSKNSEANAGNLVDKWKAHDTYAPLRFGFNTILTRSQTAFIRITNDESNLKLFCDPLMHCPPGKPHLLEVLKGEYGSIPRTIITRSCVKHLKITKKLNKKLDEYKDEGLRKNLLEELTEFQEEKGLKTPPHDEKQSEKDSGDGKMDDIKALEIQQEKKKEEAMKKAEREKSVSKTDYLKQIHDAADYYVEHKVSAENIDKGAEDPDKYD